MHHWDDEPHAAHRWSTMAAWVVLVGILIGLFVLWPTGPLPDGGNLFATDVVDGEVYAVDEAPCRNVPDLDCTIVRVEITSGDRAGDRYRQEFFGDLTDPDLAVGDRIVVNYQPGAELEFRYYFADAQRRGTLGWIAIVFAAAVIALGRWRGVKALISLGSSFVIILMFALPALVTGRPAVPVAVVAAAAVAYVTLYIAHGINIRTTVALIGSMVSLVVVGVLSALAVASARITGLASEEALYLPVIGVDIDFTGLILAGIVLGSMGALDDVTVTQSEAIAEIHHANPEIGWRPLYDAGMRIGRAHIGSTVNTLALAYAGAALPLLLLFMISDQSLGTVANSEVVSTEIIRTLAGSVGLVASVPLTTWLAAVIMARRSEPNADDAVDEPAYEQ